MLAALTPLEATVTAFKGTGITGAGAGVTSPLDMKLGQAGQVAKASATTIRAGLFWPGTGTIVSGTANMSYNVIAFTGVTQRSASAGAVFGGNDGTLNVVTTAAPGSNSRYDVVYWWNREYSLDGVDSNPVIGVVQGTAAASPTVPSLAAYPGAIELARILVPSGVTATNSGTTITQTAPFTAMAGGTVPVRSLTERNAGTWLESQKVWDISTNIEWTYDGSAWDAPHGSFIGRAIRDSNTPTIQSASFTDISTTANWITTGQGAAKGFAAYSNGWTIPVTGTYEVSYNVMTAAGCFMGITVNDSSVAAGTELEAVSSAATVQSSAGHYASIQLELTAGDVIRLFAITTSSTTTAFASVGHFTVTWVSVS